MTEFDVARNGRALRNLAARLERMGWQGDTYAEAEHIAMNLLADGYAAIETPPPPRATAELGGPGHREFQEAKARLKGACCHGLLATVAAE